MLSIYLSIHIYIYICIDANMFGVQIIGYVLALMQFINFNYNFRVTLNLIFACLHLDKNQCLKNNGNDSHNRFNERGNYKCGCSIRYTLKDDGMECKGTLTKYTLKDLFRLKLGKIDSLILSELKVSILFVSFRKIRFYASLVNAGFLLNMFGSIVHCDYYLYAVEYCKQIYFLFAILILQCEEEK